MRDKEREKGRATMKFEDAVEQYTTYLLKLSYLYVKDKQVAEDIVQDTFV